MDDFAPGNGKVGKGIVGAVLAAVKYMVIPALVLTVLINLLSGMDQEAISMGELESLRTSFTLFAIPVIALSFLVWFYPKGTYSRMTFGVLYVISVCAWLWLALQGGELSANLDIAGTTIQFTPLLLLIIFAISLKAVFFAAEAPAYREEWLRERGVSTGGDQGDDREEETEDGSDDKKKKRKFGLFGGKSRSKDDRYDHRREDEKNEEEEEEEDDGDDDDD